MTDAAGAKALLDALAATPRGAGSEGERLARARCAARLAAARFRCEEVPFAYSRFPGRWATPIAGLGVLAVTSVAGHLGYGGDRGASLLALALGLAGIGAFALWSARRGVLDAPVGRARGVNLVARRGDAEPRVWLVAHLDSKSQPIPIGVRAGAIVLAVVACLLLALLALAGARAGDDLWRVATLVGWAAAIPIVLTTVGDRSPGALDNASGVVAVLLAAESLPAEAPVGVLLTSAEELGLAGARAWVRQAAHARGSVLNCDGVDHAGGLTVLRARGGEAVAAALADAAAAERAPLRIRGLIPGVLVDAVAFSDAGWPAATLSRGTVGTLLRIHTRGDTAARLRGDGMAEAARVLAGAARALAAR